MPVLKNAKHEKFAQGIASGKSAGAAYRAAYGGTANAARANASRLIAKDSEIAKRIAELQNKAVSRSEEGTILSLIEKRQFLALVMRTPVGEIDETCSLCQRVKYTDDGKEIWMPDKLRAIELDAKLAGEMSGQDVDVKITAVVLTAGDIRAIQERRKAARE